MYHTTVYCCVQNLCEMSLNVILCFTICVKREIFDRQFSPFFVILSEKRVNFSMMSSEIAEIIWIGRKWEFNT